MKLDIPGLLSRIGELPGVINQGLLGPLPASQSMGLDPQAVEQARKSALTDMAMGMLAGSRMNNPGMGLYAARQGAQEGFKTRIVDMLKENEVQRMLEQRKAGEQYIQTLPEAMRPAATIAGAPEVARAQIGAAFAPGTDGRTDDIKEYERAVAQDGYKGTLQQWILEQKRAGATNVSTTTNLPAENSFGKTLGEKAAGQLDALQTQADSAAKLLASTARLKPLTNDPNFISGTMGDARLVVAKALGLPGAEGTQAYFAGVGEQVAERIKAFGAGTGLSDADREFAKQIAAGSIELTPGAIKRIIAMNEQSARAVLSLYNERRNFYSKKHPEVADYYPEVREQGGWSIKKKQ